MSGARPPSYAAAAAWLAANRQVANLTEGDLVDAAYAALPPIPSVTDDDRSAWMDQFHRLVDALYADYQPRKGWT